MCWLQQSAQWWHYPTFLLPLLLLIACIECFAGYRAWRFLVSLNGGVLGLVVGATLFVLLGNPLLLIVGATLGATVGALLFLWVAPLGSFVFVLGSLGSFALLLGKYSGISALWVMPIVLLAAAGAAIPAMGLYRAVVLSVTSICGAQQIASIWGAHQLPTDRIPLPNVVDLSEWAIFLALAAIGVFVQIATAPHKSCPAGKPESEAARQGHGVWQWP